MAKNRYRSKGPYTPKVERALAGALRRLRGSPESDQPSRADLAERSKTWNVYTKASAIERWAFPGPDIV